VSGRPNQLLIPKMNPTQQKLAAPSASPIVRPLGAFEEFLWLYDQTSPLHFALAAKLEGHTTISEWRRALDSLQKRHPFFSVYIEKDGSAVPNFRQDSSASIPLRVVQGANVAKRWELEVELELAIPFNAGQAPLVRAVLLLEGQQAVCILVIHHSISDGRSVAFVIRDLLQALAGKPIDPLPVLPSLEDLLGITSTDFVPTKAPAQKPPGKPLVYVDKKETRPQVRSLTLSTELTGEIRKRAREEGTTVHGALSAAIALAYREINDRFSEEPVRVLSPIDMRNMLGLGDDCALLVAAAVVAIEPDSSTTFWQIASGSTARLSVARTPEAITASKYGFHQLMKQGVNVSTPGAMAAEGFAHEITLTNLGNLAYETDFGKLKLEAVWGPGVSASTAGTHTIGVTTTNGSLKRLQTTFEEPGSLLEATEEILVYACATRKLRAC